MNCSGPESDEDDDAPGGAAARISIGYGEAMEDEDGVLRDIPRIPVERQQEPAEVPTARRFPVDRKARHSLLNHLPRTSPHHLARSSNPLLPTFSFFPKKYT